MSHSMTAAEVKLGNDIARQFGHVPREVAVDAIAQHIETFWDPRMRDNLRALVAHEPESFDPLVLGAAEVLLDRVTRRETEAQP